MKGIWGQCKTCKESPDVESGKALQDWRRRCASLGLDETSGACRSSKGQEKDDDDNGEDSDSDCDESDSREQ